MAGTKNEAHSFFQTMNPEPLAILFLRYKDRKNYFLIEALVKLEPPGISNISSIVYEAFKEDIKPGLPLRICGMIYHRSLQSPHIPTQVGNAVAPSLTEHPVYFIKNTL